MSRGTRWTVAVLIVIVALGVALWRELGDDGSPATSTGPGAARDHRDADTQEALAGPRARADLRPCPSSGGQERSDPGMDGAAGPGPEALRGITLECAGDGSSVDVASAVDGRVFVLNLWAYWCGPCADELPAMAEYQKRMGPAVTVLTVHQDENETAALLRLAELGVHLPTLQDGRRLIAAALKVPNVMPATVVLRADGSVAEVLPRSFASADEIAAAVDPKIGQKTGEPG
jgi:thiol-disulfide isomerase/thioredoxin